jgi:glutamate formiminotransferase
VGAPTLLMSAPNVSEGRDADAIDAIGRSFTGARLIDVHSDPDHGRSVFTLAGGQGSLADALAAGASEALERIDLRRHEGLHPHVGAVDVVPVVYLEEAARGAAFAEALTAAGVVGDRLEVPVFLYGQLATDPRNRERGALREGGPESLRARVERGEIAPDFGPARVDPGSGATLVTARPPLVAFNVDLASDDLALARRIAADLRESAGGPPGLRAIGLPLAARGCVQVSFNVHDPLATPLAEIVAAVAARAPVARAELVGLAPEAALDSFPADVPLLATEPCAIEDALASFEMTAEAPDGDG